MSARGGFASTFALVVACTLCVGARGAESTAVSGAVERAPAPASSTAPVTSPAPEAAAPAPAAAPAAAESLPPATPAPDTRPAVAAKPAGTRGGSGRAIDRLELDTTAITGNRELPKVMVVVPWKKSDIGDLVGKPVNSLIDEALQPVDREVFRREIDYYGALGPDRPRGETPVTDGTVGAPPEK